jgi:Ras-related protein Rab-6A
MQNFHIDKLKLVLIGNSGVGKSAIIQRMIYNMFIVNSPSTIGAAFQTLSFDGKYKIDIWDTAGQERFQSLIPMYLKSTDIIFLVVSCENTLEIIGQQINFWMNFILQNKSYIKTEYKLFLIFNKSDINSDFKIPNEILEDTQFHTIIITSAKTNQNIENLKIKIEKLADTLITIKPNQPNNTNNSQSYFRFNGLPSIPNMPTSANIKEYYANAKCSIL